MRYTNFEREYYERGSPFGRTLDEPERGVADEVAVQDEEQFEKFYAPLLKRKQMIEQDLGSTAIAAPCVLMLMVVVVAVVVVVVVVVVVMVVVVVVGVVVLLLLRADAPRPRFPGTSRKPPSQSQAPVREGSLL